MRLPKPDLTNPNLQRGLILSGALLLIIFFYFFTNFLPFFYPPREAVVTELRGQVEKLTAEVEQAKRTAENLPKLEAEMEALHVKWDEATQLLPPQKEIAVLLRKVAVAGEQTDIDFLLFEPSEPMAQTFYTEHPVSVKVRGGYHDLGEFLAGLAGMTRIVNVTNLDLKALDQERDGRGVSDQGPPMTVEAAMTITAYSLGTTQVAARDSVNMAAQAGTKPSGVNAHAASSAQRKSVPNEE
jgi:type IV pilus assembly protein PilO